MLVTTTWADATNDTLLSDIHVNRTNATYNSTGNIAVTVDGITSNVNITANETVGSFVNKLQSLGLEAGITNGELMIQSGYKDMTILPQTSDPTDVESSILTNFGLQYVDDLGGYSASDDLCEQTVWVDKELSSANYADTSTKLQELNISNGSLTVFRNGQAKLIDVNSTDTFGIFRMKVIAAFSEGDVDVEFDSNGYLRFFSDDPNVSVEVGSTTDTSNFAAICGLTNQKTGEVRSARELYKVNGDSQIVASGLFRRGQVTEGTFTIGNAEFEITNNTTLSSIISQINASEEANATASWDSIDGKLIIKSRTTGSSFINIEAGSSNFTDIMGLTSRETKADGSVVKKIVVDAQDVGENAVFSINGTYFTSTSNTITSDLSRIKGVTINLKDVSEGETVTLEIEKDKETVANAVSDIVDAYNELIENVDKEVAKGGILADQSTLKMIRNQIRSLMTSSFAGGGVFRNLDAIGISLEAATAGNISTENIDKLSFNKDRFLSAFDSDRDALKMMLVGNDTTKGIFSQVETVVESAVAGQYGYFASAERSYNNKISRLDQKIERQIKAVERYQARLEAKFSAMDLLISNIQNQYSSFLG